MGMGCPIATTVASYYRGNYSHDISSDCYGTVVNVLFICYGRKMKLKVVEKLYNWQQIHYSLIAKKKNGHS